MKLRGNYQKLINLADNESEKRKIVKLKKNFSKAQ